MHIAVDVRSLMEGRHSGVEEYTQQIVKAMARVGPRHVYHAFYNNARPITLPEFPRNVAVHGFRYPNKLLSSLQWALSRPRWDSLVRADVFFVPNPRLMPLSPERPLVSVAHDLSFERFPEFLDWRRRLWHRAMRPRELFQNSNHIIAVSEHTKLDLVSLYGISPEKISVIHSGISLQQPPMAIDVERLRIQMNLPERFILYLGRLEPRKNITGIINAFSAIFRDIPQDLVIAGESGWRQAGIDEAIRRSPAKKRIRVAGFIPEKDKGPLYAAADLFVYPSFYEGFGFPPLESLFSGTPVITSFNSALPEIVGEWATLVDPYNTSQLAAVMKEMLQLGQRVPHEVQQAVRERYSWDRAAAKTLEVLERVA